MSQNVLTPVIHGLKSFGDFFCLQVPVHAVSFWTSIQDLALMLQLHHAHRGLHIFLLRQTVKIDFFLCHSYVLPLLNHHLFTIHNVETLRGILHATALQVVDNIVNCQLSIINCLQACCLFEADELAGIATVALGIIVTQVGLVGADGSGIAQFVSRWGQDTS